MVKLQEKRFLVSPELQNLAKRFSGKAGCFACWGHLGAPPEICLSKLKRSKKTKT
jgi:hypothetical protein